MLSLGQRQRELLLWGCQLISRYSRMGDLDESLLFEDDVGAQLIIPEGVSRDDASRRAAVDTFEARVRALEVETLHFFASLQVECPPAMLSSSNHLFLHLCAQALRTGPVMAASAMWQTEQLLGHMKRRLSAKRFLVASIMHTELSETMGERIAAAQKHLAIARALDKPLLSLRAQSDADAHVLLASCELPEEKRVVQGGAAALDVVLLDVAGVRALATNPAAVGEPHGPLSRHVDAASSATRLVARVCERCQVGVDEKIFAQVVNIAGGFATLAARVVDDSTVESRSMFLLHEEHRGGVAVGIALGFLRRRESVAENGKLPADDVFALVRVVHGERQVIVVSPARHSVSALYVHPPTTVALAVLPVCLLRRRLALMPSANDFNNLAPLDGAQPRGPERDLTPRVWFVGPAALLQGFGYLRANA